MAEIPIIVINVQRGGPSTGLPTNVEQSDLNQAIYGGHGDSPRVVLAAATVEDCFYSAIEAARIARKYSTPVFLLSDTSLATRIEAFDEPDLGALMVDPTPDLSPHDTARALPSRPDHAARSARDVACATENIRSSPVSNTTKWAIPPAARNCTRP